jgi:hypothetical protein
MAAASDAEPANHQTPSAVIAGIKAVQMIRKGQVLGPKATISGLFSVLKMLIT